VIVRVYRDWKQRGRLVGRQLLINSPLWSDDDKENSLRETEAAWLSGVPS